MIAIALVSIASAMHVAVGHTAILISCLYLTSAIAQPVCGRLAEEFGPRVSAIFGLVAGFGKSLIRTGADDPEPSAARSRCFWYL